MSLSDILVQLCSFYATYSSRKKEEGSNVSKDILSIVQEKLSGRPWPPQREALADLDASSIAILSARLQLNLYPATVDARQYDEELVRNHLRMLYSVNADLHTIVTGSSPEPLTAEASAQIMHYTFPNGKPFMKLWELLWKYIDHGLAAQGATGELIGRALSISAMDHAVNRLSNVSVRELKYQTPVSVTDYYKALLTDEAWEELRHSTPANRAQLSSASANRTFEDAFRGGYFHFSHYGQANDTSPMQNTYAWAYWLRGTAIACQLNQELTDRMAPIYFPHLGGVSPKTISANLDQDKTGESVSPPTVSTQSAERLSIFSQGTKLPYIAAVHCYALTDHQGISVFKPSPQTEKLRHKEDDLEAPRYQIDFRGLSAYAIIAKTDKVIIQRMINRSKNAIFANHSRDYGINSVRQMLPLLTQHPASVQWFEASNQVTAGPSMILSSGAVSSRTSPGKRVRIPSPSMTATVATTSSTVVHPSAASAQAIPGRKKQKNKKK